VTSRIQEDIGQRVPHLARRPQHVQVVAISEDLAATPEHSIHGSRQARSDRLHARREIVPARRLDDRVQMIVLY
jgi:hypothetical protein